jgi:hypothetical protein
VSYNVIKNMGVYPYFPNLIMSIYDIYIYKYYIYVYILIYMGLAIHNFFTYFDLYVNRLCDQTRHINF